MDSEEVLKLFDSCWFESNLFQNHQKSSSSNSEANPDHEIQEKSPTEEKISRLPTFHKRSISDQSSSESSFDLKNTLSTESTIFSPKLQTILSGKESLVAKTEHPQSVSISKKTIKNRGFRKKKGLSKSLPELEFEELKGFMDLGFVFSEEDKFSSLGSTIPGLQRLGEKNDEKSIVVYVPPISRPYLSEAWEIMEKIEKEKPLMKWKVPSSMSNEIGMKHSLKSWAHSVASAVK